MTDHDAIAAQVRQDRETGTPGPWQSGIIEDGGPFAVGDRDCWPICKMAAAPGPHNGANARRIAALPDLEAAYLDLYDEVKRLLAALDDIAAAAFWIANEIHIGPEDEGRDIYDMALAIRDDASAALKGPEE